MREKLVGRGLYGMDIGKRGTEREKVKVPEALGVVTGERRRSKLYNTRLC